MRRTEGLQEIRLMRFEDAYSGAVTLIQRFGSALNLNIHFHRLFLDGVYARDGSGKFVFHYDKAPGAEQLTEVLHTISQRVASFSGEAAPQFTTLRHARDGVFWIT